MSNPSTSQKHNDFLSEPMSDKPTIMVPGVDPLSAQKMSEVGKLKASQLFGDYLVGGQKAGQYAKDLQRKYAMDAKNATIAAEAMEAYAEQHFR
uniref:Barrier-to-autointegration factor n=1 Tax=Rhabditophanes sp. KR3021 TaxID=114890 RepID=A0AC35U2T6_9BILA